MKTKTIKLYRYDELSEEAKEKAHQNFIYNNDLAFFREMLEMELEYFIEEEKEIKASDIKIETYDFSYCKGKGEDLVLSGYMSFEDFDLKIENNRIEEARYRYEYDFNDDLACLMIEKKEEEATEKAEEILERIHDKVVKSGYSQIEYEETEEYFKEMCEANDYYFNDEGDLEN